MKYLTEILASGHHKKAFVSGNEMLDNYLRKQANQDMKRKLAVCFVLVDSKAELVKGYYTLSNSSIPQDLIPVDFRKKFPKAYINLPTTLLGRLAIDHRYQKKGLGEGLLLDALRRSYELSKSMGSFAVVVDPVSSDAARFYEKYGFVKLPGSGKMLLPIKTIRPFFE